MVFAIALTIGLPHSGLNLEDVIIPLLIAPPFFFYLLSKLCQLAIAHDQLLVIASTDGLTSCLNRVASTLREVDLVGRMGGEEPSRALL